LFFGINPVLFLLSDFAKHSQEHIQLLSLSKRIYPFNKQLYFKFK